ncbi:hypothetical protein CEF21_04610 [Bacillus sp. FJAT-42376]|nr:hypothetical protein CEF21_04610 [Bacillus sp. FJAT-42376]
MGNGCAFLGEENWLLIGWRGLAGPGGCTDPQYGTAAGDGAKDDGGGVNTCFYGGGDGGLVL